jgi:hypothetical protein
MLEFIELLIHFVTAVFKLPQPGGVKVVMAETIAMKQRHVCFCYRNEKSQSVFRLWSHFDANI